MGHRTRSGLALGAALLFVLGFETRGHAEVVGFEFSGTLASVSDDTGELDPSIEVGTAFSGRVIYDSAMMPSATQFDFARYTFSSPPSLYTVTVGEVTFTAADPFEIRCPWALV